MIPRGTTPTLTFAYKTVPVETIVEAWLTMTQRGKLVVDKDIETCRKGEDTLSWSLTQEETLAIEVDAEVEIQCRYKTASGFAGASKIYKERGGKILKDGVI